MVTISASPQDQARWSFAVLALVHRRCRSLASAPTGTVLRVLSYGSEWGGAELGHKEKSCVRCLLCLLLLGSCGGEDTPAAPTPIPVTTSITLSVTSLSFASLGAISQLSATVKDQNGATMSGATVTWVI
jgi:hypothetical protein